MKLWMLVLTSMALASCDQRQPKLTDAQVEKFRKEEPGFTEECVQKFRWGGLNALPRDAHECYKFDSPRRWKGFAYLGFETSRFCPEPAHDCSNDTPGDYIWLSAAPSIKAPPWDGDTSPQLFEVDFIGRKTTYPGHYGHGAFEQEIIADRLISMKRIEIPNEE